MIAVRIDTAVFDVGAEIAALHAGRADIGAVASFVGVVRAPAEALTLEHYPGMTERAMRDIADEATARWAITAGTVVHRVGRMMAGETIVLVAIASPHRAAALEACAFVIDRLKVGAPFWKQEERDGDRRWVDAAAADDAAAARWRGAVVGPAGFEPATKPL